MRRRVIRKFLAAATLVALAAPAMAQDVPAFASDGETCACVQNFSNNACQLGA
jgi:hypothetical protein